MDNLTQAQRKLNMSRIRSANTKPEIFVRSIVRHMGFKCRLHYAKLPSKPDLVLPRAKKIIFVHGCFWHMHRCRYGMVRPVTHSGYWQKKRIGNVVRDKKNRTILKNMGWKVLIAWECWIKNSELLQQRLSEFLAV